MLVVALLVVFLAGIYVSPFIGGAKSDVNAASSGISDAGGSAVAPMVLGPYAVADVAERISPAVVYIEVQYKARDTRSRTSDPRSLFEQFFLSPWFQVPDTQPKQGTISVGTGFIIAEDGKILTNQHVVDNPEQIERISVHVLNHKEPYEAELLGSDYQLDLAVLKIKPTQGKLAVAPLGDSDLARVGEFVIAIGNPYGKEYDHTVTIGVLSAKGREITIPDFERGGTGRNYADLMQTDAAINPGNSGGPLLNLRGEVIGINTAVSTTGQGIGFAIPINTAKEVVEDLINRGKVVRPWIGIEYQTLSKEMAEYLGLGDTNGVLVRSVYRNSPAAKAGLLSGDVIRKVNGEDVKNQEEFAAAVKGMKIGDKFSFLVERVTGRQIRTITILVTVGEKPEGI